MRRLEMRNYNKKETETAKLSFLSSGKSDKYEYLTSEEILPPDQSKVLEQAKFTLGKALKKPKKMIED